MKIVNGIRNIYRIKKEGWDYSSLSAMGIHSTTVGHQTRSSVLVLQTAINPDNKVAVTGHENQSGFCSIRLPRCFRRTQVSVLVAPSIKPINRLINRIEPVNY